MPLEIMELVIQAQINEDRESTIKIEGDSYILTRKDLDDLKEEIRWQIMKELQQQISIQVKDQVGQLMEKNSLR